MCAAPRILAFSGSARRESWNRKLLAAVVEAARNANVGVKLLDLNDFSMPLYHCDLEDKDSMPENAKKLIELITQHHGLLIASPEYNSMITPLLKNTIDWCTRGDENPLIGKVAAVVSASPGMLGGVRSMTLARQLLTHLGCYVIPDQCILPQADKAFDTEGRSTANRAREAARNVGSSIVDAARKLHRIKD